MIAVDLLQSVEFLKPPVCACRAVVVIPARNEEAGLSATLDALRRQVALDGSLLPNDSFEILVLLNNCTDRSREVAEQYAARYPGLRLQVAECAFEPERAHVGTARSLLMDAACERLESVGARAGEVLAILSTDADSLVAPDWIAQNLAALARGAEAVGGVIELFAAEYAALPEGVRRAYDRDREFQQLTARLEALLDPDPADPWPRHLQHFGASLACTPQVYRRAGGLPPIKPLEDVAFVDALRRVDARLRHAPEVRIATSARLDGRAEVGLSGQFRHWQRDCDEARRHMVPSAAWLEHRFLAMGRLRALHGGCTPALLAHFPESRREGLAAVAAEGRTCSRFLERVDCDGLIDETFCGERFEEITDALAGLTEAIRRLDVRQDAPGRRA